jgi:pilus assembly protein TadC
LIAGALAFGIAVCCAAFALRGGSRVQARLARVAISTRHRAWLRTLRADTTAMKITGAFVLTIVALAISAQFSLGVLPVPIAAYLGAIVPSILTERRAAGRQRGAERGVITLVEWLHALVSTGRPLETALDTVASRGAGDPLLDATLARVRRDYTLGVPMHRALDMNGRAADIAGLVQLASRIERAREIGRGALPILQDLRDELRAAERARSLQAASHVDGQLTLVLTLCYLPALALLVIVPLFLTLLAGLFG